MRAREGQNVGGGDITLQQGAAGGRQASMRWVAGALHGVQPEGPRREAAVPSSAAAR